MTTRGGLRPPIKAITVWHGNARMVRFEDTRWGPAVQRAKAEDPPRLVFPLADFPPGWYAVESRKTMPGGLWTVHLDPETGQHIGPHNCPARAENPRGNVPCIHMAWAYLYWKVEQQERDPFIVRLREQEHHLASPTSTALAIHQEGRELVPYYVPSRQDISDTLALGKVLWETRSAAIPKALDTPYKVAAVILAGRELGVEPMTALRRIHVIDGTTVPGGEMCLALMQKAGCDLIFHENTDTVADIELVRPGRTPRRVKFTIEQAGKAGLLGKDNWKKYPADMLVWRAITRLGRTGAADIVNSIERSMVRLADFEDASRQVSVQEEREDQRQIASHDEEAEYEELREESPSPSPTPTPTSGASPEPSETPSHESPTAPADTPPPSTLSDQAEQPQQVRAEEAGASSPEPGPASEPVAPAASTATTDERGLNYKAVMQDKARHITVLSAFQRAIRGLGTVPEDADNMTLNEVVESMGGTWPNR